MTSTSSPAARGLCRARGMPLLAALWISVPLAARASGDKLAVHPLVVLEVTEREETDYRRIFQSEVARLEEDIADPFRVRVFLKEVPHQTCVSSPDLNNCLADLAKSAGAKLTLFVSLNLYPRIRLAGRIIRANGDIRVSTQREYGKRPRKNPREAVRRALHQFLVTELNVGAPDLSPLIAAQKPPERKEAVPPGSPVTPPVLIGPQLPPPEPLADATAPAGSGEPPVSITYASHEGWSWQRTTGASLLAAGVVGAGLGTYFKTQSSSSWKDFNNYPSQGYLTPSQVRDLKDIQSRAESQGTTGTILLVAGGVLAAGGAGLLIWDILTPSPRTETSVSVAPYPGGIVVSGGFQ